MTDTFTDDAFSSYGYFFPSFLPEDYIAPTADAEPLPSDERLLIKATRAAWDDMLTGDSFIAHIQRADRDMVAQGIRAAWEVFKKAVADPTVVELRLEEL